MFEKLRHTILNDVRGVFRRQQNNIKFYVTGKFVFEKWHRPGVFTDPPIFLSSNPVATTRLDHGPLKKYQKECTRKSLKKLKSSSVTVRGGC